MDKIKRFTLLGLVLLGLHNVNAQLYYYGDIILVEENVQVDITYSGERAALDVNAKYTLRNTGSDQTIEYDYYAFKELIEGDKLFLNKDEEKTIEIKRLRVIQGPTYSADIDFNLLFNGKYMGNKAEKGTFRVKFPAKPTIIAINPEPTNSTDLELLWMKRDYIPVTNMRVSWSSKDIDIGLDKEITPSVVKIGDTFTVRVRIKNDDDVTYNCRISDTYETDLFTPINEEEFRQEVPESPIEPSFWLFEREFTLSPMSEKVYEYKLRLLTSRGVNEMNLQGFRFYIPDMKFYKESGRAYIAIGICNKNGLCDLEQGENFGNCPQDCPSGSMDKYCDALKDGKCDPDCKAGEDPDCVGTTVFTTTIGTTIIEKCGNGVCDSGENYGNCPADCPSGSSDGYCDGMDDGVCDPDCKPGDDPDCVGEDHLDSSIILFIVVLIVVLVVVAALFVIYKRKREREEYDRDTIEWLRGELEEGEDPETLRKLLEEGGYDPGLLDKALRGRI